MIGRFGESGCGVRPGWPVSASASGIAAYAPTPAATAPSTDVFTKSRRENVKGSSGLLPACKQNRFHGEGRTVLAGEAGRIARAAMGFTRVSVPAQYFGGRIICRSVPRHAPV